MAFGADTYISYREALDLGRPPCLRMIRLTITADNDRRIVKVPRDCMWLMCAGQIFHQPGVNTELKFDPSADDETAVDGQGNFDFTQTIPNATPQGKYDVWGSATFEKRAGWSPMLLPHGSTVELSAGTNGDFCDLCILEFRTVKKP